MAILSKIEQELGHLLWSFRTILLHTFSAVLSTFSLAVENPHNSPVNTKESSTPTIWSQVNKKTSLEYHGDFWWRKSGRLLSALMSEAGYNNSRHREVLEFFASMIAPFLGPARVRGCWEWKSFMTDDHHPIELSWDWHTGKQSPTIRFSIEPVGVDAGTLQNPDNQFADEEFRRVMMQSLPNLDKEWLQHFSNALAPESCAGGIMEGHPSKVFYAFDLGAKEITPKLYLFPGFVARATNQTNLEVITKAICTAPHCSNTVENLPGLSIFQSFVNDPSTPPLELDMLAIDLVRPLNSRLKIYFRSRETSFQSIRQTMSLGGRVDNATLQLGLQNLKKLMNLLLETQDLPESCSLPGNSHRTAGLLYNVEFRLGGGAPKVKIYIPVRHYARSDETILRGLKEYMYGENGQAQNGEILSRPSYDHAFHTIL